MNVANAHGRERNIREALKLIQGRTDIELYGIYDKQCKKKKCWLFFTVIKTIKAVWSYWDLSLAVTHYLNHWATTTYTTILYSFTGGHSVLDIGESVHIFCSVVVVAQWLKCWPWLSSPVSAQTKIQHLRTWHWKCSSTMKMFLH